MKKLTNNIWGILYPIVVYYLISSLAFFGMTILFGESNEIYMLKQMVSSGSTIPFLLALKKQDAYAEEVVYGKERRMTLKEGACLAVLVFFSMAVLGMALNNFIAMTPLMQVSTGFQNANEAFFGGGVLFELLASCIVVPVAEELLFRGILLKRCSYLVGENWGVVFSAVLFGIIHVNLVQFIYATLLGLLLAVLVQKTKRIWTAVLGHVAVNLMAIIRTETGIFDFSYEADFAGIGFSLMLLGMGMGILWVGIRFCRRIFEADGNEEKRIS